MHTDRPAQPNNSARIRRAAALLFALGLLIALALPASAPAKRPLVTSFAALDEYQSSDSSTRNLWFGRTVDAGAGYVRLSMGWDSVAPNRPLDPTNPGSVSYDFSGFDGAVRDARAHGLNVLITVNVAPAWAEGPGRPASAAVGSWKVNPQDLADFMQAVAARYSGNFDPDGIAGQPTLPAVQALEVWNEPNSSDWINPQFQGKTILGGDSYRAMLNASYKAIKSVSPQTLVVAAGTDPYGDPPGGPYPGGNTQRVRPVTFWEQVLCVHPVKSKKKKKGKKKAAPRFARTANCQAPAMFDVLAHHPIDNTGAGPLKHGPSKDDASTPDLGRVVSVLRGAEKAGTTLGGHHPVWVTEFWWDSKPPNPVGAKLAVQAKWIEQSLYLFWKAGASLAVNFQIADNPARPDVHAGFQSGVYFADGRPKPSLTAFHFPFVTDRINSSKLLAWGKAPESGKLLIQRQQGSRWITVKKLRVAKGAVFTSTLRLRGKQRLRATVAGTQSLVWKQTGGGATVAGDGSGLPGPLLFIGIALLSLIVAVGVLRRRQVIQRRQAVGRAPARPAIG
jgi:hypothetical protein